MTDTTPGPAGSAPGQGPPFGRPTRKDAVSGFVTGLFSIPEGRAYAGLGGVRPAARTVAGEYEQAEKHRHDR